jgi:hypothetical protein
MHNPTPAKSHSNPLVFDPAEDCSFFISLSED